MIQRASAALRPYLSDFAEGMALLAAFDALNELDRGVWSAPQHNRAVNRFSKALAALRKNPEALQGVRVTVAESAHDEDRVLGGLILEPPVSALWRTPIALLAHETVALSDQDVETHPTLFLVEDVQVSPDNDDVPEEAMRYLSHFGGAPLAEPGAEPPDAPLVMQLDLREVAAIDDAVDGVLGGVSLPSDGVLQVFTHGVSDSRTDAAVGGGVSMRYLKEAVVTDAQAVARDVDLFEPVWMGFDPGLTYTAKDSLDFDAIDRLVALEAATYATATMRFPTREALDTVETQPSSFRPLPTRHVSQLLGAPSVEYPLDPQDVELLNERLPLGSDDDEHVMLVAIRGTGTLETAFGDEGWLQVWLRRSDLEARQFGSIVSFVKSS